MDEEIDYYFLVNKETDTEEEMLNLFEDIAGWQIAIGSIPESTQYELIKSN